MEEIKKMCDEIYSALVGKVKEDKIKKIINEIQRFYDNTKYKEQFEKGIKILKRIIKKATIKEEGNYISFILNDFRVKYCFECEKSINVTSAIKSGCCYIKDFREVFREIIREKNTCKYYKYGMEIEWSMRMNNFYLPCINIFQQFWKFIKSEKSGYDGSGNTTWEWRSKTSNILNEIVIEMENVSNNLAKLVDDIRKSQIIKNILINGDGEIEYIFNDRPCGLHLTIHAKYVNLLWLDVLAKWWNELCNEEVKKRSKIRYNAGYGWSSRLRDKKDSFCCPKHNTIEYRVFTAPLLHSPSEIKFFIENILLKIEKHLYDKEYEDYLKKNNVIQNENLIKKEVEICVI